MVKQILKGIVIGIANIIPGVSGGTMAVSMGIYDKIIHAVTHIRTEFKEGVKLLLPIVIGAGIGIAGLSYLIEFLFFQFPVQTNFLFIGLIIGGMPVILNRIKATKKKITPGNMCSLVIFFAVVVILATIGETERHVTHVGFNLINSMKFFGVGVIASATMIIPGVSGSMVMMLLGYYSVIIEAITQFMTALVSFEWVGLMQATAVLFPFGVGVLIGIVLIAKFVEWVFKKLPNYAYFSILGLIIASPIAIIVMSDLSRYNVVSVLTGLVALAIGYVGARKLGEE